MLLIGRLLVGVVRWLVRDGFVERVCILWFLVLVGNGGMESFVKSFVLSDYIMKSFVENLIDVC